MKKFKVCLKNPKGNVVKVNLDKVVTKKGNQKLENQIQRKLWERHNCDNGKKTPKRYWSCREVKLKIYFMKRKTTKVNKSQLESKEYGLMIYKIIQNVDKDGDGEVEFP